jgi:hypothetical protein
LYDISTPNPLEGLVLSQKCAVFVNHMLNAMISGALNPEADAVKDSKEIVIDTNYSKSEQKDSTVSVQII